MNNKEENKSEEQGIPAEEQVENNTIEESSETVVEEKKEPTLEEQLASEKDKSLRLFAEFENYKKRTTKERMDLYRTANIEIMTAMIPVLDDVERAYKEITKNADKEVVQGIDLIKNKLFSILEDNGLERMDTEAGEDLDTDKHEAITKIPAPTDTLKNKIVDCIEVGYTLNGKVIRFAKVVMGV